MSTVPTDSGANGNNAIPPETSGDGGKKDSVSYETHTRLLEQRKKDQEKMRETQAQLETLLKDKQDREKQELEAQGNYKKMLEQERLEKEAIKKAKAESDMRWITAKKLDAVMQKLPGKVAKPEYLSFLDLEKIAIDPETEEVDMATAEAAAGEFVSKYSELIQSSGKTLPNKSAAGGSTTITYEQWVKMPLKEKLKYKPSDISRGK